MRLLPVIVVTAMLFMFGNIAVCPAPVSAASVHIPNVQAPSSHAPATHPQSAGKCSPGSMFTKHQGKDVCVKCNSGFTYAKSRARTCAYAAVTALPTRNISGTISAYNAIPVSRI